MPITNPKPTQHGQAGASGTPRPSSARLIQPPPSRYHPQPFIPRVPLPTPRQQPPKQEAPPTPLDAEHSKKYFSIFLNRKHVTKHEYKQFLQEDQRKYVCVHPIKNIKLPGPSELLKIREPVRSTPFKSGRSPEGSSSVKGPYSVERLSVKPSGHPSTSNTNSAASKPDAAIAELDNSNRVENVKDTDKSDTDRADKFDQKKSDQAKAAQEKDTEGKAVQEKALTDEDEEVDQAMAEKAKPIQEKSDDEMTEDEDEEEENVDEEWTDQEEFDEEMLDQEETDREDEEESDQDSVEASDQDYVEETDMDDDE